MADFNFSTYVAYFKNLAEKHIEIQHSDSVAEKKFFQSNPMQSEVIRSNAGGLDYPYMAVERLDGGFVDNLSDDVKLKRIGAIWLMDHVPEQDDAEAEFAVYDKCEHIMQDILAQMRLDKETCVFLRNFNPEDVTFVHVGPFGDNQYGVRFQFSFTISSKNNLFKDNSRWL